ncbi:MAG TPA: peptidyl-prolyl cis-trans isomerase [Capsulimonadaceae bacterium]|nr:peptidyl-prolyl cis-trans isomerase [Capsulimonadaceae bacterium]
MALFPFDRAGDSSRNRKIGIGSLLLSGLVACSMGALVAGCHGSSGGGGMSGGSATQDETVAKVNSDTITVGDMYDFMRRLTPQQLSANATVGKFAISQLITSSLVTQLAASDKVPVTDQQVDQRFKDLELVSGWEYTLPYDQLLDAQSQTEDSIKRYALRPQMAQFNIITRNLQITPAEIQAYYNAHKADYTVHQALEVDRIVVPTQQAAQTIYNSVSKGAPMSSFQSQNMAPATPGADPALFVQWIATKPPAKTLGPLAAPLAKAKVGDTLNPVQVGQAWWVVHVIGQRPDTVTPFDQVQHIIQMTILQSKAGADASTNFIHDLQQFDQSASINITPKEYQDIATQLKNPTPAQPQVAMPPTGAPAPAPAAPKK